MFDVATDFPLNVDELWTLYPNPLLELWGQARGDRHYVGYELRHKLCHLFSWAVPDSIALNRILRFSEGRLVEMGAGTGYWAKLLAKKGADIIAYDRKTVLEDNPYHDKAQAQYYFPVRLGGPPVLKKHADRTLFLCWPPYATRMAHRCLKHFRGDKLVYVGEGSWGCTGDEKFHEKLNKEWQTVDVYHLPNWAGIHDNLVFFRRIG